MVEPLRRSLLAALVLAGLLWAGAGWAQDDASAAEDPLSIAFEQAPPRLALVEGAVSFWRPGDEDWTIAPANLPLASGDRLQTGDRGRLEIELGAGSFLRASAGTELALARRAPDLVALDVGPGLASLDLRSLPPGQRIELATPNVAFTIADAGYYRLDVESDTTSFTSRRGGSATLTPAEGPPLAIGPDEQVVVTGGDAVHVASFAAAELDGWDRWNERRSDRQLDSLSARYVPAGIQGVSDLDTYGDWRSAEPYGSIWIPRSVRSGWVPYGFGRWLWDPVFGWTWVDDAPWGWAPFHHGRWIFVTGRWAWAPGPIGVRPYYAPALVAFFGPRRRPFGISWGAPSVAWVPLGWGEPCLPWWGPTRWAGRPHWLGWGGPRVVNQAVIQPQTVVQADAIRAYENARLSGGLVAMPRSAFGRARVDRMRAPGISPLRLEPVRGAIPLERAGVGLTSATSRVGPPPSTLLERRLAPTRSAVERARALQLPRPRESSVGRSVPNVLAAERTRIPRPDARGNPASGVDRGRSGSGRTSRDAPGLPPGDTSPRAPSPVIRAPTGLR